MPVRHVLVVDDSKSARLMLRKMLQGFGLTVDMAESAEDALNYLRDQRPEAILMDHTMPGMDGLTAVRQIRNDPATAAIPIAMYTSKDDPGYQMQARAAGAIGVLTKPAMPDVLGVTLERMHQAFDAASISSAALVAPAAGITIEQVEKLALEKAEMVFYEAIESQVLPLINDVIAKLRRDKYGISSERRARLIDQLELQLEELEAAIGAGMPLSTALKMAYDIGYEDGIKAAQIAA